MAGKSYGDMYTSCIILNNNILAYGFLPLAGTKKEKELAVEYPYTHFIPQIWDATQYVRYEKVTYVAVPALTDELVTQDMTKIQKKRYLKNKPRK